MIIDRAILIILLEHISQKLSDFIQRAASDGLTCLFALVPSLLQFLIRLAASIEIPLLIRFDLKLFMPPETSCFE